MQYVSQTKRTMSTYLKRQQEQTTHSTNSKRQFVRINGDHGHQKKPLHIVTWNVNSIKQRILEIEDLPMEKDHTKIIFVDRQGARHNRNNFRRCHYVYQTKRTRLTYLCRHQELTEHFYSK